MNSKNSNRQKEIPKCIVCGKTGKKWYQPFPSKDGKRMVDYCCDCWDESYRKRPKNDSGLK